MVHPSQQRASYAARRPSWAVVCRRGGATTRSIAIRPVVAASLFSAFTLLLVGYVGATAYLIYRDDIVGAAVSRQVSMQYAYEERIAALRSELDRLTSRHVVQTENVEQQLAALLEHQAMIESRQSALDSIVNRAKAAGIGVAAGAPAAELPPDNASDDAPADSDSDSVAPLSYMSSQKSTQDPISNVLLRGSTNKISQLDANVRPLLSRLRTSLDGTEADLSQTLDTLSNAAQSKADRLEIALAPIGVGMSGTGDGESGEPEGGPFIPMAGMHFVE